VGAAAGATGGHKVVHATRQVTEQDVVFDEPGRVLLVDQTEGGVAGVVGGAAGVGRGVLLAAVAACDVDVAVRGVVRGSQGVVLRAIAGCARVQDHRSRRRRVDLAVGAGDLRVVVDDERALHGRLSVG